MDDNDTLRFLLTDHLGSTSITADTNGSLSSMLRYKAWGENRYTNGTTPTSYHFTGQREESGLGAGVYFYGARWYDSGLGRFLQADTVVPGAGNPQAYNRYSYVLNNPLRYIDPTGHENEASDFIQGVLSQWSFNNNWWNPVAQQAVKVTPNESEWKTAGRHIGNVASMIQGIGEASAGSGFMLGGAVICGTGILCAPGVILIAGGATFAAHGAGTALTAAAQEGGLLGDGLVKMLGQQGPQFPSQTLWQGKQGHLDVENPAPGSRPGQIHFQTPGRGKGVLKWTYDPTTGDFLPAGKGVLPPKWLTDLLKDEKFLKGLEKGLRYLGEPQ